MHSKSIKKTIVCLFLFALASCNAQNKNEEHNHDRSTEKSTVNNLSSDKESIVDYNLILKNKTLNGLEVSHLNIGNLNVPTGKIIVCDPLVSSNWIPLSKNINPGSYPIKIYIAKTENAGNRFALAQLQISDKKASKWVLAIQENESINELIEDDSFFGFSVDSGLASFFDYQTGLEYDKFENQFYKNNPGKNIYDDFLDAEFQKNKLNKDDVTEVGSWINYKFPNTELNIPMFESGFGDGVYPAYWGIDEDGEITSLIIDFLVIELPELRK